MTTEEKKKKNWWGELKQRISRVNPFVALSLLFIIMMILPGDYNFWNHLKYSRQIKSQEKEISQLKESIEEASKQLEELQYERDMLEKYAREEYLMKAEDEDVFLIK